MLQKQAKLKFYVENKILSLRENIPYICQDCLPKFQWIKFNSTSKLEHYEQMILENSGNIIHEMCISEKCSIIRI